MISSCRCTRPFLALASLYLIDTAVFSFRIRLAVYRCSCKSTRAGAESERRSVFARRGSISRRSRGSREWETTSAFHSGKVGALLDLPRVAKVRPERGELSILVSTRLEFKRNIEERDIPTNSAPEVLAVGSVLARHAGRSDRPSPSLKRNVPPLSFCARVVARARLESRN